jgi:hypothetical protein
MKVIWMILIALVIGTMIFCWTMRCLEWADRQDTMTVYEQMIKGSPTAAGKKR